MSTKSKSLAARKRQNDLVGYLFLAPTLIGIALFMLYPIFEGFRLSFFKSNGTMESFVGLSNYEYILTNEVFGKAIFTTFLIAFFQLLISIPVGFVIAIMINSISFGKNILKAMYFIPYITPGVAAGALFLFVLHPEGILNMLLGYVGIEPIIWLEQATTARAGAVLLGVWKTLGFNVIIFLAYLQAISPEYYEAASVDGCSRFKSHIYITAPQMTGAFSFLIIMGWIQGLQRFTDVYILGGQTGAPARSLYTIVGFIYERGFGNYEFGIASAASYILFMIILVFTFINMRITKMKL